MKEPLIDMRVWRQFVAVAEELHFGRAAQRLHITQPPLTQAIAQLEKTLGVLLFDRTSRRVLLTPAGEALLPDVRELLARAQALPARARAAAQGEVGRVRLAFVSTIAFERLPEWVRDFRLLCPQVALELVEATGDVQRALFARGELDAGLILHSPGFALPELARLPVAEEPLVLALPAQHPLAMAPQLSMDEVLAFRAASCRHCMMLFLGYIMRQAGFRWWRKRPFRCRPSSIWCGAAWVWPGCPRA